MKNFFKIIAFLLIIVCLIIGIGSILTPNDPTWDSFYNEPEDSIDVLLLGSSNIYSNINPAILWNEHGIASFNLCGSGQPIWNSYYYLKEAYKTQTPKLIVLDLLGVSFDMEYSDTPNALMNTVGIKSFDIRYQALKASLPTNLVLDAALSLPAYHERLKEFDGDWDNFIYGDYVNGALKKGFHPIFIYSDIAPTEMTKNSTIKSPINQKNMEYIQKIVELAREKGSQILFIKTPGSFSDYAYGAFNALGEWANTKGIEFLNMNYNYDEFGFDFATDLADIVHFTSTGVEKTSIYLGNYIKQKFDIPDRRGDNIYTSYNTYLDHYKSTDFQCPPILSKELIYSNNQSFKIPATVDANVFQDLIKVDKNTYYQTIIEFDPSDINTSFIYDFFNDGYDFLDQEQRIVIKDRNTVNIIFNTKDSPSEIYFRIISRFSEDFTVNDLKIYKLITS